MPQRCSVLHGIGIGDQDGCQARVFSNPTRPKSEPKSATFRGCVSRNDLMPGRRASRSHLPLIVMPQRCSVYIVFGPPGSSGRSKCPKSPPRPVGSETSNGRSIITTNNALFFFCWAMLWCCCCCCACIFICENIPGHEPRTGGKTGELGSDEACTRNVSVSSLLFRQGRQHGRQQGIFLT